MRENLRNVQLVQEAAILSATAVTPGKLLWAKKTSLWMHISASTLYLAVQRLSSMPTAVQAGQC